MDVEYDPERNGGFIMTIVTYSREAGTGLTPEERAMLEEAEKLPQIYDKDCPKLTPEQLAEFRPVYYANMEERAEAIRSEKTPVLTGA